MSHNFTYTIEFIIDSSHYVFFPRGTDTVHTIRQVFFPALGVGRWGRPKMYIPDATNVCLFKLTFRSLFMLNMIAIA